MSLLECDEVDLTVTYQDTSSQVLSYEQVLDLLHENVAIPADFIATLSASWADTEND